MSCITSWPCLHFFREDDKQCDKWVPEPGYFCEKCNSQRHPHLVRLELWELAHMRQLQDIMGRLQAVDLDQTKVTQMLQEQRDNTALLKMRKALQMYSMEGDSTYERIREIVEAAITEWEEKNEGNKGTGQADGNV